MYLMNSQHTTGDMLTSKKDFLNPKPKTFINILFVYLLVHFIHSFFFFFIWHPLLCTIRLRATSYACLSLSQPLTIKGIPS